MESKRINQAKDLDVESRIPNRSFSGYVRSMSYFALALLGVGGLFGFGLAMMSGYGGGNDEAKIQLQADPIASQTPKDRTPFLSGPKQIPIPILGNGPCGQRLLFTTSPSSVFNPNNAYNLSFTQGSTNMFQDINGDNLPDYVFSSGSIDGGTTALWQHSACVFLNNGNGWTKAYECYAVTHVNRDTGEITIGQYYGDCAGSN